MISKFHIWRGYIDRDNPDGGVTIREDAPQEAKDAYESYVTLKRFGYEDGICSDKKFDELLSKGLVEERLRPRPGWFV